MSSATYIADIYENFQGKKQVSNYIPQKYEIWLSIHALDTDSEVPIQVAYYKNVGINI